MPKTAYKSRTSFLETESGDVKELHGFDPPCYRLRVGDWRVRFHDHADWIDILRVRNRKDAYR
jgi:mRNA-degrading endonuclease RelE of RelBE toxin-antitoxin system